MNKKIPILFFLFLFLFSCSKTEKRSIKLEVKQAENTYFEIKNQGKKTATFTIDINGKGLYNLDKMFDFIRNKYPDMPVAEKAWRFVSHYSRHLKLITKNNWLYDPLLLMNSAGGSYCGFRSAAMTNILKSMGEEARSWCIEGHVITEVLVDGRWQVYDPDLGVVYYNKRGEICSFEELCDHTELITSPEKIISITNICDSIRAVSQEFADFYASKEDNILFNTDFPQNKKPEMIQFEIPSRAKLCFPLSLKNADKDFAFACVEIPPGWNGEIKIPLILYTIDGSATLYYSDKEIHAEKKQINDIVSKNVQFEYQIKIKNNNKGLKLYYYINPLIYFLEEKNDIIIKGKNINDLIFTAMPYGENNRPGWKTPCDPEVEKMYHFALKCKKLKEFKTTSFDDYVHKVSLFNECGAFKEFNIDSLKIFNYLDSVSVLYRNNDTIDWGYFDRIDNFILSFHEFILNKKTYNKRDTIENEH